jgi:hypothetical protein
MQKVIYYFLLILITATLFSSDYSSANESMIDSSGFESKLFNKLKQQISIEDIDFRLVNQFGNGISLSDYYNKSEIYVFSLNPKCEPEKVIQFAKQLKSKSKGKKEVLFLLDSALSTRESLIKDFPNQSILLDENQQVSKSFSFKNAGDYVIINSKKQLVVELKSVFSKKQKQENCKINYEEYELGKFKSDIIPALNRSCVGCHAHQGFLNYFHDIKTISSWQKMMLRTIRLRRMPPGADPYYGKLTTLHDAKDVRLITKWLEAGIFNEPLVEENYQAHINLLKKRKDIARNQFEGKVITLFSLPPEQVPESGLPFYKHYTTETPTTEDYYFRSFSVKLNENVAHHIALHFSDSPFPRVDPMGNPIIENSKDNSAVYKSLYGNNIEKIIGTSSNSKISGIAFRDPNIIHISRTSGIQRATNQTVYFIPKGSYLNFEVHYSPSGRAESSQNELIIHHDEKLIGSPQIKRFSMTPDRGVVVSKAYEKPRLVKMSYTLKKPINLLGYGLHMHYRGRSGKLLYRLPGEKVNQVAFSFPTYQYKIQVTSLLNSSLFLPEGTILTSEIMYDNSKENFSNPDPSLVIKIGTSILNEENYLPRFLYTEIK